MESSEFMKPSKILLFSLLFPLTSIAQVMDSRVTQENLPQTICSASPLWKTSARRPPASYTNKYKYAFLQAKGLPKSDASKYELDHIIAIEDGGHPKDPKNFQLQPWNGPKGAHAKDVQENAWHKKLCSGEVTLQQMQEYFTTNWIVK